MVTSRDIQEIISKLSSDKAKTREEGIKLLNSWLEGERSVGFCKFLGQNTAKLKPDQVPHAETWPFLITLLTQCTSLEISASKRRPPKLIFAKTLRMVIQRAEDAKFSGKMLLLSVVKPLLTHIWDVLRDVSGFQSEYGIILRQLLAVKDYRFHMRKRVYCSLVILYMGKVEASLSEKNNIQFNPREEVFRCILTLHCLLENPPGDFPDNLRENVVKGFVGIFSYVRDEGKISRKLMECINTYMLKDGPNLGFWSLKIHSAMQEFVFRYWLTTHDRGLKDALILYAHLQLKLTRTSADGSHLLEQLLDVVVKELDQSNMPCTIMPRSDGTREDKSGTLTSSQGSLLELAATVFYRACVGTSKACSEKRCRRENAAALVREGLKNGRWLWHGAFCYLTRRYHFRIIKDLFIYWFEGICESFERVLNDANTKHAYDGLLWVLRSLQELSIVPLLSVSSVKIFKCSSTTSNELCGGWHAIWSSLMHGLPIFSNVTSVADAALVVLGNIIANDLVSRPIVPQDVWDLRLFKHKPSVSGLYFISCYFSRKGSEGNIRDVLHLRQDLLRVVVRLLSWKEPSVLNERVIVLLPGSIYSLCDGCNPFTNYYSGLSGSHSYADVSEAIEDCLKVEEHDCAAQEELFECYVDALAEIKLGSCVEVSQSQSQPSLRLPRQIRDPLVHEMENCLLALLDIEINKIPLSDLFFLCALLSNFIYGLILTRLNEEKSSSFTKSCQLLLELLEYAVSFVHKTNDDLLHPGYSGACPSFDDTISILSSVKIFLHCPLFIFWREQNFVDEISIETIDLVERLLRALAKLFEECLACARDLQFQTDTPDFYLSSRTSENSSALDVNKSRIVDLELDVNVNIENSDILAVSGKVVTGISFSSVKWKLDMVLVMSSFFFVLPVVTWGILFGLMEKEDHPMVVENILYSLCEHSTCVSTAMFSDLVNFMHKMAEARFNLRLCCVNMLAAICSLMRTLLFSMSGGKDKNIDLSLLQSASKESLESLGDLVNKIAEHDLIDWFGRIKLIDCICNFFRLDPHMGQLMIERLLMMHHDTDYRVRLFLARRIGVLFQIWDGHNDLFQDICSNFGVKLVLFSKDKLVSAKEVLADASQPPPVMETIIVALAHVALYSERIELEAIFMICVIAAIDPCQRDLAYAILNNLSRQLQYETRPKYLEELMGSIIFCWVACDVSLVALFEIRDLFVSGTEPRSFLQCCCHWLLPALLLHGDTSNLKWAAAVASQPLAVLVKGHFVPIFAICMTLHCSKKSGWEEGRMVLQNSILHIAEICVDERDNLIKKHMVSIVSFMLSLSSRSSDPRAPFFSQDTIVLAIRTIVDGFLEMEDCSTNVGVVDKINIFRPDRVFMFILEMHYKVSAAVHHRHRCNWLSGIEVLVKIIGHRALVSSTSCYLFNLIGQYISCQALQEQCCLILSMLLKSFKTNPTKETTCVLGQQLQFLVPKLIECCIPSETGEEHSGTQSSRVVGLLHELTVDADSSLHDFIRELEPFPEINCFNEIRRFHEELCVSYHPRDRFLNFVKRSCYFPPKLLLWSLRALHKKLLLGDIIQHGKNMENSGGQSKEWHCEPEIVSAVWTLVPLCGLHDANSFTALVSDFIARVGISDPHGVVFRLPGDSHQMLFLRPTIRDSAIEFPLDSEMGVSDELLIELIRLLMKYLLDDSVKIIDKTSQALRGILSTERGQKALFSFDTYERSLIAIHSKGINMELVEKFLLDLERKSEAEAISLEMSSVWKTRGKTFQSWISPLVYSLISYSNDLTLRLCQDIVLVKAEVAELLLPSILINLARRKDLNVDICKLISSQVQENIFIESNDLNRSIQVVLDALNELRLCHVMENASSSVILPKQDSLKSVRPSSCTKSHKKQEKAKDSNTRSNAVAMSTTSWEKVYWLSIDYLLVAKSAIQCGSYFTSVMYVEHWCEEHFKSLTLGSPDFSHLEMLPAHIEILISAVTQINEPDSLYGIIQSHKLASQLITYEHEGNWSKALEYYDLQVRSAPGMQMDGCSKNLTAQCFQPGIQLSMYESQDEMTQQKPYKGLIRALQRIGCSHVLDLYCQGLTSQKSHFQNDPEFRELQYEAAWRAGNWDFSLLYMEANSRTAGQCIRNDHFNENLHSCLRALQEGDFNEFHRKLVDSKQELVFSVYQASRESTEYIYSSIVKLQILDHLGMAWDLRWKPSPCGRAKSLLDKQKVPSQPVIPTMDQVAWLNTNWSCILQQAQLHMNLFEPFIAFRRVLLQILSCNEWTIQNLLQSASILRKSSRFTLAAAALQELKFFTAGMERQCSTSYLCFLGRLEEAKLLRAQGQNEMAISLAKYISHNYQLNGEASNVHRLIGKWLAETRSSNSKTILEQYLKRAVELSEANNSTDEKCFARLCQTQFHLAHYTDALFKNYEERLNSSEWQAAIRLRKHKAKELEALSKRLKSSIKGEKTDYSAKIQELKQQLTMDNEEAEKLHDDRDNFLNLALEGYKRCLVIGDKYDVQVVFRLVSLWFSLSSRQNVVYAMLSTVKEVQSYKFIPLVYQIASRMGSSKDGHGPHSFQFALVSLVKKMAMDHPYHTIFQLLALANGDRVKDKQRSRDSFVVDMDKKLAAENLLSELSSHHGAIIRQMKQMVEIYIKLAELETKREDTNKRIPLPREIRSLRQLELVPVVTASFPVDRSCQYHEGSFPHFKGLADSVMIMNGINAPKVVECLGSDGNKYRQLAKSGNDDLRQDAVMEQFFGLVNTFLLNHRDTWKRRLGVRTYKVVPFTPSAGVLEWVDGTIPLGEYLIGSTRSGGAHGRYGFGDWSFLQCRVHMTNEKDKRKAFQKVCENFRPVMHYFFLERFIKPADWFEKRLAYTRSVAASSMVGYIVGLGDRHSMNILIDQATAEVVHIDLGVAFEQGLMLKTPERVPFRLTRDIMDGMGVTGVEGIFRRCCEETVSVMRTNKEALLTIIEVFIHDPLYKWALSPLKALQRQKETDDDLVSSLEGSQDEYEGNKDAARALMRVKQKLDGYEEGEMRSVHGQVQQLIQDAIDPERLCQMFPGWGAWL